MFENLTNSVASFKFNKHIFRTTISLYQIVKVKCAVFFCVLDFFYLLDKHCRGSPTYSFQKVKWIGGIEGQYEVDDYTLEYIKDEGKYYISFKDSADRDCKIEIDKGTFEIYRESKSTYIKIKNEKKDI